MADLLLEISSHWKEEQTECQKCFSCEDIARKRKALSEETKRRISEAHLAYQKRRRENVS